MSQDGLTVNVFRHLQPRYLDQKLEGIQGKQILTNKMGIVIEGSSICYQYSEWSELIANFSSLMSTFHSLSIQWIESYTSIQECVQQLCTISENTIPDFARKDHFDMASINIFIETLHTLITHANDRFQQIITHASNLLNKREKLVSERGAYQKEVPKDTSKVNKLATELLRVKQAIEQIDMELSQLYANACSLTSVYTTELSNSLQTAFTSLRSGLPFSQPDTTQLPVVAPDVTVKPRFDFDSLLSSAFSQPPSLATSVMGDQSRRVSMMEGLSVVSQQDSFFEEDFPPVPETPIQEGVLIAPMTDTPSEIQEEYLPVLEEKADVMDSRIQVLCYNHQTNAITSLLAQLNVDVIAVEATATHLLMLTSRGSVLSFLWDSSICPLYSGLADLPAEQLENPTLVSSFQLERAIRSKRFTAISCGQSISTALASTGEVYTWGEGKFGELGQGEVEVIPHPQICVQLLQYSVVKVVCGDHHVLALDANGTVFAWGCNEQGQLGLGDTKNRKEPTPIPFFKKMTIVDIAAGNQFSACVDSIGRVYCFGCNDRGQCAGASSPQCITPALVQNISNEVVNICCGCSHTLALCSSGAVYAWGCGLHGEIGVNYPIVYATKPQLVPLASLLEDDEEVVFIRCGDHRCGVVTSRCRLLTWGENDFMTPSFRTLTSASGCIVDLSLTTHHTVLLHDSMHESLSPSLLLTPTPSVRNIQEKKPGTDKARLLSHDWELQQRQLIRQWTELIETPGLSLKNSHAASTYLEKGIPPVLRSTLWPRLIGNVLKITPETYEIYRNRATGTVRVGAESSESNELGKEATVRLIDEDLKRTFVPLGFFSIGEPLYHKIREMLLIYAYYRPDIGYVQGMSFIAGILALHIPDNYLCFQCLANLLGSEHLIAFYSLKPSFMKRYYEVFNTLFATINSSLYNYFNTNFIQTDLYLFKWLQSLFAQCFPIDITSRVLDNFLYEGTSFLFRTAFSILKLLQPSIMKLPIEEVFALLTGSIKMEAIWKETVTMDSLFTTLQKIRFTEKQQQMIQELVDNAFFYEDKDNTTKKNKRKTIQLSKDEVRRALSTVF